MDLVDIEYQLEDIVEASLLEVMDAIPGSAGQKFEPPAITVRFKPADLS